MNIVIPMVGRGTRMNSDKPKPLIEIEGRPMIELAVESLAIEGNYVFVIREYEEEKYNILLETSLRKIRPNCTIVYVDFVTEGPVSSALMAESFIDGEEELIIANCDQILRWDSEKFLEETRRDDLDAIVVTWDKIKPTESFVELNEQGYAVRFKEKEIISKHPLNGIHYWKKGSHFVSSAKEQIERNIRTNDEFYISESFNVMIEMGLKITNFSITKHQHFPVGTEADIKRYLDRIAVENE